MNREDKRPEVGMGAALQVGSDLYPCTIVEVSASRKTVIFTRDRTAGHGVYVPNTDGRREQASLRQCGTYYKSGGRHFRLYIGERDSYTDRSF